MLRYSLFNRLQELTTYWKQRPYATYLILLFTLLWDKAMFVLLLRTLKAESLSLWVGPCFLISLLLSYFCLSLFTWRTIKEVDKPLPPLSSESWHPELIARIKPINNQQQAA